MKLLRSLGRLPKAEDGQALVEFALLAPILLLLVVGLFEFGRAWNAHQAITDGAREAARRAVINDPSVTQDSIVNDAKRLIISNALDTSLVQVTLPDGFHQGTGLNTRVRVVYPYQFRFLAPLVNLATGGSSGVVNLTSEFRMRNE
jgi:Flp pilus assembly protein TadG